MSFNKPPTPCPKPPAKAKQTCSKCKQRPSNGPLCTFCKPKKPIKQKAFKRITEGRKALQQQLGEPILGTGQKQLFDALYAALPHKQSQISGKPLKPPGHKQFYWQFSHVLSKQVYTKSLLDPNNIVICTPQEHTLWTTQPWKVKHLPEWQFKFALVETLMQQYNNKPTTPKL